MYPKSYDEGFDPDVPRVEAIGIVEVKANFLIPQHNLRANNVKLYPGLIGNEQFENVYAKTPEYWVDMKNGDRVPGRFVEKLINPFDFQCFSHPLFMALNGSHTRLGAILIGEAILRGER